MVRLVVRAVAAFFGPKASLVAENLCLRQQILILQRRHPRSRLQDQDRRFWILASRWCPQWRKSLVIVTPGTVLGWHRKGWKAYWCWRSRRRDRSGRKTIRSDVKLLIRYIVTENFLWDRNVSRRSWLDWASRSPPGPSRRPCEASIEERHRRAGAIFSPRMPVKSGPATSSACGAPENSPHMAAFFPRPPFSGSGESEAQAEVYKWTSSLTCPQADKCTKYLDSAYPTPVPFSPIPLNSPKLASTANYPAAPSANCSAPLVVFSHTFLGKLLSFGYVSRGHQFRSDASVFRCVLTFPR